MKRSLLDITQKISRKVNLCYVKPYDLTNDTYWIYIAENYRFVDLLREIEYRNEQDRLKVRINTQYIGSRDFELEQSGTGLLIKFIKSKFQYPLDELDEIIISGDIESYA